MWLVLLAVALVAVACAIPYEQILRFRATNARLLRALNAAKQQLIMNGVTVAKQIIVTNQGDEKAIMVEFASGSEGDGELQRQCGVDHPDLNGCTVYKDSSYNVDGIWMRESLDDARLETLMLHEMIHALFPGIEHLEPDQTGVFTLNSNSPTLTADDLALIGQYTTVET